jgi:transposase-like protein
MMEFMREFPDDAACLEHLWRERYAPDGHTTHCPKCDKERRFHRVKDRPAYDCDTCGHHIHPTAGTIFHKSSTSLHLWFYAAYMITSTRCGVSAKTLERELGVTYKTAWRMFNLIRNELMKQDDEPPLSGEVEVDETFVGRKPRQSDIARRKAYGWNPQTDYWSRKAIVFGAVERGGRIKAEVVPTSRASVVLPKVREFVLPASLVYTDEYRGYDKLTKAGYRHKRIKHKARIYVEGETHTQTIEGWFSLLKNGIRASHHGVSHKWLQGYVNEYVWRWNRRGIGHSMFLDVIAEAVSRAR